MNSPKPKPSLGRLEQTAFDQPGQSARFGSVEVVYDRSLRSYVYRHNGVRQARAFIAEKLQ